jgi:hypothetical protein
MRKVCLAVDLIFITFNSQFTNQPKHYFHLYHRLMCPIAASCQLPMVLLAKFEHLVLVLKCLADHRGLQFGESNEAWRPVAVVDGLGNEKEIGI